MVNLFVYMVILLSLRMFTFRLPIEMLIFNSLEVLPSASDNAKLFAENFSQNSNLDDSGISLPVFPSRTNLKLHISVRWLKRS